MLLAYLKFYLLYVNSKGDFRIRELCDVRKDEGYSSHTVLYSCFSRSHLILFS